MYGEVITPASPLWIQGSKHQIQAVGEDEVIESLSDHIQEMYVRNNECLTIWGAGGSLGKKLILQVNEISHKGNRIPFILENSTIKEALLTISEMGFGVTGVLNRKDEMIGIITDGDIRRGLSKKGNKLFNHKVVDIMSKKPKSIKEDILAIEALRIMEKHSITSLFTYGKSPKGKPSGIIHIHDILKLGIK